VGHLIERLLAPLRRRLRLMVLRAVVAQVDDGKPLQLVQIVGLAGEAADDVPHLQPYGLTAVPLPGAEGLALTVGGAASHRVLVAVDDRRVRPTGLLPGEVMLYGPLGQQVHLTALGKIKIGNDTAELLDVVHQLLDYVQTKISFSNGGGPTGPPSNAAELLLTRAALELLKE